MMRITIKSEGRKYWIPIPMWLGGIGLKYGMKYGAREHLSKEQMEEIFKLYKVLKQCTKEYKGLKIVEVQEGNGRNGITIIL